jgi:hypothetical protein
MAYEKKPVHFDRVIPPSAGDTPNAKPELPARPASPPDGPAKKFPRAEETPAKKGPGRPPKIPATRGEASKAPAASRAAESPAVAPALFPHKPDPLEGMGIRGLMQLLGGTCALATHFTLKLSLIEAGTIWTFSKEELDRIEGPGGPFLGKYAPFLDAWSVELDFAGALIPIVGAKLFAVLAAKKALEAKNLQPPPGVGPKKVSEIRPAPAATAAPPTNETADTRAASAGADAESPLPSAFEHTRVDDRAELL